MKVAYLVNTYPSPSHSFIRREIQALERQGHRGPPVRAAAPTGPRWSIRPTCDGAGADRARAAAGRRLPLALLAAAGCGAPRRALAALRLAARLARGVDRGARPITSSTWPRRRISPAGAGSSASRTCTPTSAPTRPRSRCSLRRSAARASASPSTVRRSSTGPTPWRSARRCDAPPSPSRSARTAAASSAAGWSTAPGTGSTSCTAASSPRAFRRRAAARQGRRSLVSIGRLVEQKGQLLLIDALRRGGRGRQPTSL